MESYVYALVGLLWVGWARREQVRLYPATSLRKLLVVIALNYLFWPACVLIALFNIRREHERSSKRCIHRVRG